MQDHEKEQLNTLEGGGDINAKATKNDKSFKMCGSKMSSKVNISISCHWPEITKNICGDVP